MSLLDVVLGDQFLEARDAWVVVYGLAQREHLDLVDQSSL